MEPSMEMLSMIDWCCKEIFKASRFNQVWPRGWIDLEVNLDRLYTWQQMLLMLWLRSGWILNTRTRKFTQLSIRDIPLKNNSWNVLINRKDQQVALIGAGEEPDNCHSPSRIEWSRIRFSSAQPISWPGPAMSMNNCSMADRSGVCWRMSGRTSEI